MVYCANNHLIIAIVAGEHSGDSYGSMIMQSIEQKYPEKKITFIGVGGPKMLAAGLKPLMPMDILSVIGIVNVLKNIYSIIKAKNKLVQDIIKYKPNCFIGIDAPDFNLVVAGNLKKAAAKNNQSIKTIQYISPTIWAWRARRIYTVARNTDTVLCIFPFEQDIYQKQNIAAKFVGHPLADKLHSRTSIDQDNSLRKVFNYLNCNGPDENNKNIKNIGLFPGSRSGEISALAPVFLKTAFRLHQENKNFSFIVPIVSVKLYKLWLELYQVFLDECTTHKKIPIKIIKLYESSNDVTLNSLDIMRACDLILCASGTTTLEAFLLGVPMVVAYKVSKLNELLIKLLIKVRFVAMPNILSDKLFGNPIVPEYLQNQVTEENLSQAVLSELNLGGINGCKKEQWQKIQNYLKTDNIDHVKAVTAEIGEVMGI